MIGPGMSLVSSVSALCFERVLAQAAPRSRGPEWDPAFLIISLLLVVILLAGAALIALASRWRRRRGEDRLSPSDQLAQFRSLYEKGEISQEEFQRLRSLLGGKIRAGQDGAPSRPETPAGDSPKNATNPDQPAPPHNPSGPSPSPEDGIRPA